MPGRRAFARPTNARKARPRRRIPIRPRTDKRCRGQGQEIEPGQASEDQGENQTGTAAANPRKTLPSNGEETQTRQNQNPDEPQTTGSTNAAADITDEQRTQLRSSFHEHHVKPVAHVDFAINVGVAVPGTIVLHPIPAPIVGIVPAYRGYEYFEL